MTNLHAFCTSQSHLSPFAQIFEFWVLNYCDLLVKGLQAR